jgi:nitroimidazol reductase NimA-like FMN-containing flavoprotein (pyridoxamine 5'-phosphate oxidase superfamily)
MSLSMTRAERESFLAGVHVGVLGVTESDGTALAVPIWYAYEPGGDVRVVTGDESRKGRALRASGRFSLCAQTEVAPYQYVTVTGSVVEQRPVQVADRRELAHRYLGPELGDMYVEATAEHEADSSVFVLRPERWMTVDYNKQFG